MISGVSRAVASRVSSRFDSASYFLFSSWKRAPSRVLMRCCTCTNRATCDSVSSPDAGGSNAVLLATSRSMSGTDARAEKSATVDLTLL